MTSYGIQHRYTHTPDTRILRNHRKLFRSFVCLFVCLSTGLPLVFVMLSIIIASTSQGGIHANYVQASMLVSGLEHSRVGFSGYLYFMMSNARRKDRPVTASLSTFFRSCWLSTTNNLVWTFAVPVAVISLVRKIGSYREERGYLSFTQI